MRNRREEKPRADRGRDKMVPVGASTQTDDEFWGQVHETSAVRDEGARLRSTGFRSGQ